ncbi:MAG: hypothetical protein IKY43_00565 [Bacteroidales bacterium]|nr:hypothetical protein [Bacteroidales bacterium]
MATKQQLTCFLSGLVGLKACANQLNAKMLLCKPMVQSSEKLLRCANTLWKGSRLWTFGGDSVSIKNGVANHKLCSGVWWIVYENLYGFGV